MKAPHIEMVDGKPVGSSDYSPSELADWLRQYADEEGDDDLRGYLLWSAEKLEGMAQRREALEGALNEMAKYLVPLKSERKD